MEVAYTVVVEVLNTALVVHGQVHRVAEALLIRTLALSLLTIARIVLLTLQREVRMAM